MEFSLEDAVLTINDMRLGGFENAQDAISVAPVGDAGDLTYSISGKAVFVHSCNKGMIITIKILQHAEANKVLNDLYTAQTSDSRNSSSNLIAYEDLRNGDKFSLTDCWFTTYPTIARGTSHNTMTWTLKSAGSNFKLTEGK